MVNALLISLMFPTDMSVDIFGLRLSMYRFVLIFGFIKCYSTYSNNVKRHACDYLILIISLWIFLSISVNNGLDRGIKSGGIIAIETCSPYMIARVYINSANKLVKSIKTYVMLVVFLPILSIPENIYGTNFVKNLVLGTNTEVNEIRLGFYRAESVFDHPILLGVFCASSLSLYMSMKKRSFLKIGIIIISSLASLSSVSFIMVILQFLFKYISRFKIKKIYFIYTFIIYLFVDIVLQKNVLNFILSHFTLNPQTAFFRKLIWEHVGKNISSNPLFGIGYNDWVRPSWMPGSVDSFWLVEALKFGLPVLIPLIIMSYIVLFRTCGDKNEVIRNYEKGIVMCFLSLVIAGFTVHFWNSIYVLFFFISGMSFFNYK